MAFLNPGAAGRGVPRAEINMIPLIDVMLVLLVIFMITAPLLTHAVKLDLPRASSSHEAAADKVDVSIDAAGQYYWNGEPVDAAALEARFNALGRSKPATEIHLYADKMARYEQVAEAMAQAARAGLGRIGFVTQPASSGA
jgi:biopolymer transport protein ExbD